MIFAEVREVASGPAASFRCAQQPRRYRSKANFSFDALYHRIYEYTASLAPRRGPVSGRGLERGIAPWHDRPDRLLHHRPGGQFRGKCRAVSPAYQGLVRRRFSVGTGRGQSRQAGVAVTLPKPQTSGAKSAGRFGKPDFVYLAKDDVYRCPAGEKLAEHFTADADGQTMPHYLTKACRTCPLKDRCTTANERRLKRWEHEHVIDATQTRLDH